VIAFFLQNDAFMNTLMGFVSGAFDPWINSIIMQAEIDNSMTTLNLVLQVSAMQPLTLKWSDSFILTAITQITMEHETDY
jgi:hypothetical protein